MTEDDGSPFESESDESAPARERTTPVDADAAFDLLADAERRAILEYLRSDADGTATVGELTAVVRRRPRDAGGRRNGDGPDHEAGRMDGGRETGGEESDGCAVARDRAAVRVHHKHLPKLVDTGVADYDRRSETVRYWGNSFLEALLDAGRGDEPTPAAEGGAAESTNSEAE